jgi:hypothetical protein
LPASAGMAAICAFRPAGIEPHFASGATATVESSLTKRS